MALALQAVLVWFCWSLATATASPSQQQQQQLPPLLPYNTSGAVYGRRLAYTGASCSGAAVLEEQLRVGDGTCLQYFNVYEGAQSFRLYRAVSKHNASETFVLTENFKDAHCGTKTYLSRGTVPAQQCLVDKTHVGLSYRISWSESPPPPLQLIGYTESYSSSCSASADALPLLRRVYASSNLCWEHPGTTQSFVFTCRTILTEHWDKFFTLVNVVRTCGSPNNDFVSKFYMPPQECQAAQLFPGQGLLFNMWSPHSNGSTTIMSLAAGGLSQSLSCSEPESAFFLQQLDDMTRVWFVRLASAIVALLSSLLTIAVVMAMKKWTDATRIILYLAVAQLCYDLSFISPLPEGPSVATDSSYIMAGILSHYFIRVFSVCTLLVSNVLAFTVFYIVVRMQQLNIRKQLGALMVTALIVGVALPLPTLLVELRALSANSSSRLTLDNGETNDRSSGAVGLVVVGAVQVVAICFNIAAFVAVTLNRIRTGGIGSFRDCCEATPHKGKQKADPLTEICKRLAYYPLIQACTQLPSIWYIYDGFLKEVSDDTYDSLMYRMFEYVHAAASPSAGLWFCIVFVFYHPSAKKTLWTMFKRLVGLHSAAALTALLQDEHHRNESAEKRRILEMLRERGVPEWDIEREYNAHLKQEAALVRARALHPGVDDETLREQIANEERASLGSYLGLKRGAGRTAAATPWLAAAGFVGQGNDDEDDEDDDEITGKGDALELGSRYLETGGEGGGAGGGGARLRRMTDAQLRAMDDEDLVELACVQRRFERHHSRHSEHQQSSSPSRSRKKASVFVSMTQIFAHGAMRSSITAVELSEQANPMRNSEPRPLSVEHPSASLAHSPAAVSALSPSPPMRLNPVPLADPAQSSPPAPPPPPPPPPPPAAPPPPPQRSI